jgi:hypothetical protein
LAAHVPVDVHTQSRAKLDFAVEATATFAAVAAVGALVACVNEVVQAAAVAIFDFVVEVSGSIAAASAAVACITEVLQVVAAAPAGAGVGAAAVTFGFGFEVAESPAVVAVADVVRETEAVLAAVATVSFDSAVEEAGWLAAGAGAVVACITEVVQDAAAAVAAVPFDFAVEVAESLVALAAAAVACTTEVVQAVAGGGEAAETVAAVAVAAVFGCIAVVVQTAPSFYRSYHCSLQQASLEMNAVDAAGCFAAAAAEVVQAVAADVADEPLLDFAVEVAATAALVDRIVEVVQAIQSCCCRYRCSQPLA